MGRSSGSGQITQAFIHGVASGDPTPDAVMLWTRVSGALGNVPLRLTVDALRLLRGEALGRAALPRPGDGWHGETVGAYVTSNSELDRIFV